MAVFNPQVPQTQDPNYLGYSHPTSQPEANKSKGMALETVGSTLESGAQLADFLVKKNIDDGLHHDIDTQRDEYTNALSSAEKALQGQGQGTNLIDTGGAGQGSEETKPQPPAALTDMTRQMTNAFNLRGNGKISDTDYKARLDMISKDYRSRYPGWRDYIDQKVESITGENPANARIKGLLGDINSYITNAITEKNKIRTQLIDNPFPGAANMLQGFDSGRINQYQVIQWLEARKGQEAVWKYYSAANNLIKDNRSLQKDDASDKANYIASQIASNAFDNMKTQGGLNIPQTLQGFMEGRIKMGDEEWRQLSMAADSNRLDTAKYIKAQITQKFGQTLSGQQIDEIVNSNLYMHDQLSTAINSKDKGAAFAHFNLGNAVMADGMYNYLGDINVRTLGQLLHFFNQAGGPNSMQEAFKTVIASNIPQQLQQKFTIDMMRVMSQIPADVRKYQGPLTMTKLLDENSARGLPDNPQYNSGVAHVPTEMLKPGYDDKAKINISRFTFDPDVKERNLDYFGKTTTEKTQLFLQWTAPAMTRENKRLADAYDPSIFQNYRDWTERNYVRLFRSKIQDIEAMKDIQNVQLQWNPSELRLDAIPTRVTRPDRFSDTRDPHSVVPKVQGQLNELNAVFNNMAEIARYSGQEPHEYIVRTLKQLGVDLDGLGLKAMKYSAEGPSNEQRGSLKSFLANPVGIQPSENNSPVGSASPGNGNLGDIMGIQVDDIPKGMDAQHFIRLLKARENIRNAR